MSEDYRAHLHKQIEMHKDLERVYTAKRYSPAYSQIYQRHWNASLCELAGLKADALVLDYGCGTGILFPAFEARGWRAVGIDLSFEMLTSPGTPFADVARICADGCNTPFADKSFDAVFCRGAIHHVPNLRTAFQEIARILKQGGRLIFSEPSNDSIINRTARRIMYRRSAEFHEEDEGFRRSEINALLEEAGFEIEVSRGFGFLAYTLAGFPDKLDILGKLPGNCALTRLLIRVDRLLESLPLINRMALHWQIRAKKR